jgi:two-component system cell cycle response regulator
MSARVLVVDDLAPNRKLLEARLTAEYFDVVLASNGPEALTICAAGECDIVLLDVMMPGMDGFEVCRRLKEDPQTQHISVVMVTALDQPADRVRGLEAGADDFLTKPIDEIALIARVRSLTRLKVVFDELRGRVAATADLGMTNALSVAMQDDKKTGHILLVEDREASANHIKTAFRNNYTVDVETNPQEALFKAADGPYDLFIVSLSLEGHDGLRLCSQLRALARTRHTPILIITEPDDRARLLRGLEIGVNDYLQRPIDRNELTARVRTQVRRKHYADTLRDSVQASIEMAVIDALTGLNNRRYFETHFSGHVDQAARKGRPLSLMILDIDFFKSVNDTHGHDAGDEVLKSFAARMRKVIRASDLVCRLGGEEFVVVMPDTPAEIARGIAERIRMAVEQDPFTVSPNKPAIPVTVSVGLAERGHDTVSDEIYRRADRALYRSKASGRNRVTADAA